MWSMAGVVTRSLHSAEGFEMVFWRSSISAVTVFALLFVPRGVDLRARWVAAGAALWVSGLCWAVMFTCFMLALTLTTVANVLIIQSLGPIFTALMVRLVLKRALALHTWLAMVLAGAGMAIMYAGDVDALSGRHALGMLVALCIPIASAVNLVVLQRAGKSIDLRAAVAVGAAISAVVALPLALPLQADAHDILLLAFLGVFQLSVPCLFLVLAARKLAAHEIALLALLEVIFGVAWAWLFAGEAPGPMVLLGGAVVLAVLALHELWSAGLLTRRLVLIRK
jgi:drug/metabolite transporter (DMT)-like permease